MTDKGDDTYKMHISGVKYSWPRVRPISWPPNYESMGEMPTVLVWQSMHSMHSSHQCVLVANDWRFRRYFWPVTSATCIPIQMTSPEFRSCFFGNTFWLGWATGFKLSAMRSCRWPESTDTQHSLLNDQVRFLSFYAARWKKGICVLLFSYFYGVVSYC